MKVTLRAARVNKGLTMVNAANQLGVTSETLRKYERGTKFPRIDFCFRAAKLYECSVDEMDFLCHSNSLVASE